MDLIGITKRQQAVLRFALHRFMTDAYGRANLAAQDARGRTFPTGTAERFLQDAKDAEDLMRLIKDTG